MLLLFLVISQHLSLLYHLPLPHLSQQQLVVEANRHNNFEQVKNIPRVYKNSS
jgi:hypothetical protein